MSLFTFRFFSYFDLSLLWNVLTIFPWIFAVESEWNTQIYKHTQTHVLISVVIFFLTHYLWTNNNNVKCDYFPIPSNLITSLRKEGRFEVSLISLKSLFQEPILAYSEPSFKSIIKMLYWGINNKNILEVHSREWALANFSLEPASNFPK